MSQPFRVHTPENVAVSYDLAGVGSRFLAALVDTTLQMIALLLLVVATLLIAGWTQTSGLLETLGGIDDALAAWLVAILVLAIFLALFGYYVAFELLWHGQTPGKRLLRLRVLRDTGYPIGPLESLIRNFVRLIDFLPTSYGVGVLTMLLDARSRRLGDIAAGTIVVKEARQLRPTDLAPSTPAAPSERPAALPGVERLTADDYTLVREYLLRRDALAPAAAAELARDLATTFASRLDLPPPEAPAEADALLANLAAAYRAHHGGR